MYEVFSGGYTLIKSLCTGDMSYYSSKTSLGDCESQEFWITDVLISFSFYPIATGLLINLSRVTFGFFLYDEDPNCFGLVSMYGLLYLLSIILLFMSFLWSFLIKLLFTDSHTYCSHLTFLLWSGKYSSSLCSFDSVSIGFRVEAAQVEVGFRCSWS